MAKRLIVNADGFGFTPGINKGTAESISQGIVQSVSCVVNFPYINEIKSLIAQFPFVSAGVHFNLSVGKPVLNQSLIPSLVKDNGDFWGKELPRRLLLGKVKFSEMVKELDAQAKVLADMGVQITHFDGHQNKHLFPPFFLAALQVAKKWNINKLRCHRRYLFVADVRKRKLALASYYLKNPKQILTHAFARITTLYANIRGFRTADRLISPAYADSTKKYLLQTWMSIMETMPQGTSEIYCHPAYVDDVLKNHATYVYEREDEVKILTSDEVKNAVIKNGIELISFKEL
jgi:predicted glycoside hydrolase/deacetylase ChbG (UPF0249 family)